MQILALDTTMRFCSVALSKKKQELSYVQKCSREHTQYVLPLIQDILQKGNVSLQELDILAFARGPGGFSGVRICLAIAQGLALGANIPLTGISTLKSMAQAAWRYQHAQRVLVATDAHMGEIYWAEYQRDNYGNWHGEETESLRHPTDIIKRMTLLKDQWVCIGTGWKMYPQLLKVSHLDLIITEIETSNAVDIIPLAQKTLALGYEILPRNAAPTYLRNKVC
ncbi:tRNA (adenosine(37)-N6)-threonylcarbamoyltransferase complex dimerization subunit type 1 TsaB [Candidatus Erwinia haradaeae]|uniref:tRNA threonylcarbamoyladenosine biosynthesis protein TsaB n=1 Tax=Candidatus Erwinia haradaeae TaxID=1922217 RepID=A0A451DAH7_9GAMM|nr:tRNA (adenosine(37)-N6)-threonylcarbamoyltransferase complex dimerization subunit type 1 TsaB [Candidatus Erwinia haradaeae]VFP83341.1 tRNA threonylcarbamoyladenosine biosynthesis protein TsaB [Candidatus Erwinia haradaeae]